MKNPRRCGRLRMGCVWTLGLLLLGAAGCVRPTRPVSMEMSSPQGQWRLDGIQQADLQLSGWQLRIVESRVADLKPPLLEKLVLQVVNTSPGLPLVLEPGEATITGLNDRPIILGPDGTVVLVRNQHCTFIYDPGMRAPLLPYPFKVRLTVFRSLGFKDPHSVTLTLY